MSYSARSGPEPKTSFQRWLVYAIHNYPTFTSPPDNGGDLFNKWATSTLQSKIFTSPPIVADDRNFKLWAISEIQKCLTS